MMSRSVGVTRLSTPSVWSSTVMLFVYTTPECVKSSKRADWICEYYVSVLTPLAHERWNWSNSAAYLTYFVESMSRQELISLSYLLFMTTFQVGDDSSSESSSVVRGPESEPKEIDWARCFSSVHASLTNVMYFVWFRVRPRCEWMRTGVFFFFPWVGWGWVTIVPSDEKYDLFCDVLTAVIVAFWVCGEKKRSDMEKP